MKNFFLKLRKRVQGNYYADFASIFRGSGLEVDDFRQYQPGDPARFINRKMSAKHDKLFVDIFQEDRNTTVYLYLDINANRLAGKRISNHDMIIGYMRDIALYCHQHHLRTERIWTDNTGVFQTIHVGTDESILYQTLEKLAKEIPHHKKRTYHTSLEQYIIHAKRLKKRAALIFLSDFLGLEQTQAQTIKLLQDKNAVYAFQVPTSALEGKNFHHRFVQEHKQEQIGVKLHQIGA